MSIEITYKYEVLRGGKYLGVLPNVSSHFTYYQDINTVGCQTIITTAQDIDTQQMPVAFLTDESGIQLTDENGVSLTTDRVADTYGGTIFNSLIQNGNQIRIWEYTKWQPNGVLVFNGIIKRWNPHLGNSDAVDLTVLNYGAVEFDNQILYGNLAPDQVISPSNISVPLSGVPGGVGAYSAQTITTGDTVTNISGVSFFGGASNGSLNATVKLYTYSAGSNPDAGTLLGTATATSTTKILPWIGQTLPLLTFTFSSPITVSPSTAYSFVVYATSGILFLGVSASANYAFGSTYGNGGSGWIAQADPLPIITYTTNSYGGFTNTIFVKTDPAVMVNTFMTNYISGGGKVSIGNITNTSAIATYPFVLNTMLEGMNACLTLAPSGYYWYIDPGSNALYFQPKNNTPDHIFTFKVHVNAFELLVTSETTANVAYLTAANDVRGNAILVSAQNNTSIANYGQVITRLTDNRIIDKSTAQLVVNNYINTHSSENFQSTINIFQTAYDLTTLTLGQIIGFNGFNSYADSLIMQIISITRHPDYSTIGLGTVPIRTSNKVERIERAFLSAQTVNNPLSAI